MSSISIDRSDLEKIIDALAKAREHFELRDKANAVLHLSPPRLCPLASLMVAAHERGARMLEEADKTARIIEADCDHCGAKPGSLHADNCLTRNFVCGICSSLDPDHQCVR